MNWVSICDNRDQIIAYSSSDGKFMLVADIVSGMIPTKDGRFSRSLVWKIFDLKSGQGLSSSPVHFKP